MEYDGPKENCFLQNLEVLLLNGAPTPFPFENTISKEPGPGEVVTELLGKTL